MQKKDLDNGITKDEFKTLDQIKRELKGEDDESKKLLELLDNLTATVEQEEYKENDGNHTNDTQTIAITNKLSGTKSIEFHKQWNDIYAFDSGKRPDLYLTLYQLTGDNLITEYREYHWDKSLQTEEGEGGQQGQGEETEEPPQEGGTETQAQDNYYWTCIFNNLPKYDEDGNEIFYYAVENLAVNDPSTFHYAYPVFEYGEKTFDSVYGEGGKPSLPSKEDNKDDETGQEILKEVKDDKVALLEGGTFVNNLEEDVTINGVKLWANLPLTASEADLPSVTFNVYQFSSDVTGTSDSNNGTLVAKLEVTSEMWKNSSQDGSITANGNQYTFTIDEMNVEAHTGPLPLYDEDGRRYTYTLEETLGTADDDPNVDWTLVYHNETFNEYQITNTYDPQLGALSVKKLLQVDARWPSGQYPAITMFLERGLMENGTWVKDETYQGETIVWTSTQVEEAAKAQSNPPEQTVVISSRGTDGESIFLFKNLEMYAPNGEVYYYRVVEQLDNMHYEAAVVSEDDSSTNGVGKDLGNVSDINDVFGDKGYQAEEGKAELATKPLRPIENEDWSNGSGGSVESDGNVNPEALTPRATFGDRYQQGEITLKGTKKWNDQGDALGLRPSKEEFKKNVKLYRYAEPQEGQDNGIGSSTSPILVENASFTWSGTDTDTWNYEITGLEQYAPNGMPWIYVVKEESTGTTWEAYILTDEEGKEITEVSKSAKDAENGVLTLPEMHNHLTVTHTFTKNWENAGDDNLTWENIGVEEMKVTGTLYVGVMENGTLKEQTGGAVMVKASEFFKSGWDGWFDTGYKFEQSQSINVGTEGKIVFDNLPLVQKNDGDSTSPLVYVVAETKVEFAVGGQAYSQKFEPEFKVENDNLIITYKAEGLMVDNEDAGEVFFTPQSQSIPLSSLANKTATESSATNAIGTMELTIKKIWNDNNDAEKLRPKSVDLVILKDAKDEQEEVARADLFASREIRTTLDNVVLKANGEPYTVNISGDGSVTVSDLPSVGFDEKGNLITYQYTVRELRPEWQDDDILNEEDILEAGGKYNPYYTVSYNDDALTVTNTLTHMDITAVKAWKPEGLHGDYAEVTFELQSRVEGAGEWSKADVGKQENPVTLDGKTEAPAWTVIWTELPRENDEEEKLEYRVIETLSKHFESDEDKKESVEIIYPEETITGTTDKTYTVTNIPLGQITVTKEGGDGNGLAGVEFTLKSDSSTQMPVVGTTDVNGELTFAKLPLYDEQTGEPITYTLTETSTPDGYIQLTEPIEVSFTAETKPDGGVYWETDDGFLLHAVEYEVVNGQYFPVIHTGGSGFYWPGVLGAGAAAAGVLYLIRRKTKGHNTER